MKTSILEDKSFRFATRMVDLSRYLKFEHQEYILSKQVLRSGTAIGALLREAKYAQSKQDFLNKQMIALKEANETDYWIELLYTTGYISNAMFQSLKPDMVELLKMLVVSTKSVKASL